MAKLAGIHLVLPLLVVFCSALIILVCKQILFKFSLTDGIVSCIALWVIAGYDNQLNAEPEKLLLGIQLLILWFCLRLAFLNLPKLNFWISVLLCFVGIMEAITGLCQLYGLATSNHGLFRITGHFYNPAPFSGFLAMILPIGVYYLLRYHRFYKSWKSPFMYAYYAGGILLISTILVLPAGQSRIAWLAAVVSSAFVYIKEKQIWQKSYKLYRKRPFLMTVSILSALVISGVMIGEVYSMKKDSADGRLLMWKITTRAIRDNNWKGTGLGGFPADFAKAQATYFSNGDGTEQERLVAGSPEYAFNEYLQIVTEHGLLGLLLFLCLVFISLYKGIKHSQTYTVACVLSLLIFCIASYPLQLPEFWLVLVILLVALNTTNVVQENKILQKKEPRIRKYIFLSFMTLLCLISRCTAMKYEYLYEANLKWRGLQTQYGISRTVDKNESYQALYPQLAHKPQFLFEAAQHYKDSGDYTKAITLLERAEQLSADPMIGYMIAKNFQFLGEFQKAENRLKYSIDILPERIYPYYLLAKLYADTLLNDSLKFRETAYILLNKIPKVESQATREMKNEIKRMLDSQIKEI